MFIQIFALVKKEFSSFFGNISGYIIAAIFLFGMALFLWIFPNQHNILDSGYANLNPLFSISPWLFIFLCSAITMKSFAEEQQHGTMELLFIRPLSKTQIVVGKVLGSWLIALVVIFMMIAWYVTIGFISAQKGDLDSGAFWGSMLGLVLLSLIYISIGVFSSSITNNQIFAFILGASLCFLFYIGFQLISSLFSIGYYTNLINSLGIDQHYKSISRGVIDSRDLLYFAVVTTIFIFSTVGIIKKK